MDKDLTGFTKDEIVEIVTRLGGQKYLAGYIFSFLHSKNAADISQITPLSKAFRQHLIDEGFFISRLKIGRKLTDPDDTIKYLFILPDGLSIESVLLFDDDRKTLCISTQVGCAMGCIFCATGRIKLKRSLTAGEIAGQVDVVCADGFKVNNVVFMGMGEPLVNYDNTIRAVRILNDPAGRKIGIRHLTVSTCGLAEGIRKLAAEDIQPRLAVSINAADDKLRRTLMPIAAKEPLGKLFDALKTYQHRTGQRVTFEYVLIKDINDSKEDAEKLVKFVSNFKCNVNLIEFNPTPACKFAASSPARMKLFLDFLQQQGVEAVIRRKKGSRIKAACGQLGADWCMDYHRLHRQHREL